MHLGISLKSFLVTFSFLHHISPNHLPYFSQGTLYPNHVVPSTALPLCIGTTNWGHLEDKMQFDKKIIFFKILKNLISLNKYKTIFLYHQFLTSKQPWSSKNAKVIGHTSTKNPLVNKANSYQFINLKFYKILNCWKTNDAKFEKFSEHL